MDPCAGQALLAAACAVDPHHLSRSPEPSEAPHTSLARPLVRFAAAMEAHPVAKIHTYGKAPRPGRKVGHVNVAGADLDDVAYQARAAAAFFQD